MNSTGSCNIRWLFTQPGGPTLCYMWAPSPVLCWGMKTARQNLSSVLFNFLVLHIWWAFYKYVIKWKYTSLSPNLNPCCAEICFGQVVKVVLLCMSVHCGYVRVLLKATPSHRSQERYQHLCLQLKTRNISNVCSTWYTVGPFWSEDRQQAWAREKVMWKEIWPAKLHCACHTQFTLNLLND